MGLFMCREFEVSQIDPSPTPHCLIDGDCGFPSGMMDGIQCLLCAVRKRLIGGIDRVIPRFRNFGNPLDETFFSFPLCDRLPIGTLRKRVLPIRISSLNMPKSGFLPIRPSFLPIQFLILGSRSRAIIVDNDFVYLSVPFPGDKNSRSCVFKHRGQIRKNKTLRK